MLDHKDALIELEHLKELRLKKAQIEEELKETNSLITDKVRELVDYFETSNQLSVKIKGLGTCSLTSTKHYSVDKEDPRSAEAFEKFVKDKGEWDLVVAPHWKKIHGYYSEKLELNEELPPGVKTYIKNNIVIRGT